MSILFHEDLLIEMQREEIEDRLVVTPLLDPAQVGSGTIDLRLGTEFLETSRSTRQIVDPLAPEDSAANRDFGPEGRVYVPLGDGYVLHPGQFLLGSTLEFIQFPPGIGGQVLGRSSWGRLGLLVATAVVVQPGFQGVLTLELVNTGNIPIMLCPGLRVAQLQIWRATQPTSHPYSLDGKYTMPLGPQSPKLAWESGERDQLTEISDRMHARVARTRVGLGG